MSVTKARGWLSVLLGPRCGDEWRLPKRRDGSSGRLFDLSIHELGDSFAEAPRARFEEAMFVAREQLDAADLIAEAPHRAESIHIVSRALKAIEVGIEHLMDGLPSGLNAEEVAPTALLRVVRSSRERLESMPRLDAQLPVDDIRFWQTTRRCAQSLCSELLAVARPRRAVVARRVALATSALVSIALLLVAWIVLARLKDRFTVTASDFYASNRPPSPFHPEQAVDGDPATEWLAPDGSDGWFELTFARPTHVTAIRILNASNPPYNDRGAKDLEIELYAGARLVRRKKVVLHATESPGAMQDFAIEGTEVTRVRLTPQSHFGRSAGFAELEVIEKAQ